MIQADSCNFWLQESFFALATNTTRTAQQNIMPTSTVINYYDTFAST